MRGKGSNVRFIFIIIIVAVIVSSLSNLFFGDTFSSPINFIKNLIGFSISYFIAKLIDARIK